MTLPTLLIITAIQIGWSTHPSSTLFTAMCRSCTLSWMLRGELAEIPFCRLDHNPRVNPACAPQNFKLPSWDPNWKQEQNATLKFNPNVGQSLRSSRPVCLGLQSNFLSGTSLGLQINFLSKCRVLPFKHCSKYATFRHLFHELSKQLKSLVKSIRCFNKTTCRHTGFWFWSLERLRHNTQFPCYNTWGGTWVSICTITRIF